MRALQIRILLGNITRNHCEKWRVSVRLRWRIRTIVEINDESCFCVGANAQMSKRVSTSPTEHT